MSSSARHRSVLARHGVDETTIRNHLALDDALGMDTQASPSPASSLALPLLITRPWPRLLASSPSLGTDTQAAELGTLQSTLVAMDHSIATMAALLVTPLRRRLVDSIGHFLSDELAEAPIQGRRFRDGGGGTEAERHQRAEVRRQRRRQQRAALVAREQQLRDRAILEGGREAFGGELRCARATIACPPLSFLASRVLILPSHS